MGCTLYINIISLQYIHMTVIVVIQKLDVMISLSFLLRPELNIAEAQYKYEYLLLLTVS